MSDIMLDIQIESLVKMARDNGRDAAGSLSLKSEIRTRGGRRDRHHEVAVDDNRLGRDW